MNSPLTAALSAALSAALPACAPAAARTVVVTVALTAALTLVACRYPDGLRRWVASTAVPIVLLGQVRAQGRVRVPVALGTVAVEGQDRGQVSQSVRRTRPNQAAYF